MCVASEISLAFGRQNTMAVHTSVVDWMIWCKCEHTTALGSLEKVCSTLKPGFGFDWAQPDEGFWPSDRKCHHSCCHDAYNLECNTIHCLYSFSLYASRTGHAALVSPFPSLNESQLYEACATSRSTPHAIECLHILFNFSPTQLPGLHLGRLSRWPCRAEIHPRAVIRKGAVRQFCSVFGLPLGLSCQQSAWRFSR